MKGGLGRHFVRIDAVEPVNTSTGLPVLSVAGRDRFKIVRRVMARRGRDFIQDQMDHSFPPETESSSNSIIRISSTTIKGLYTDYTNISILLYIRSMFVTHPGND